MPTLHLLGTGAAISDGSRTTTMLAFESDGHSVVVDCGGDVVQRLLAHELSLEKIEALILTHEHPDHVAGFPLFMERIWLSGRSAPIPVLGPEPALSQARRCFETFDTSGWEGLPEIEWQTVALSEGAPVLRNGRWRITASPGDHSVPVIGVRVEAAGGGSVAYSCDTAYSEAIVRLAKDARILVHEAAPEEMPGHSTVEEAARAAQQAGAERLVMVHLPPGVSDEDLEAGRKFFSDLEFGRDGASYRF